VKNFHSKITAFVIYNVHDNVYKLSMLLLLLLLMFEIIIWLLLIDFLLAAMLNSSLKRCFM